MTPWYKTEPYHPPTMIRSNLKLRTKFKEWYAPNRSYDNVIVNQFFCLEPLKYSRDQRLVLRFSYPHRYQHSTTRGCNGWAGLPDRVTLARFIRNLAPHQGGRTPGAPGPWIFCDSAAAYGKSGAGNSFIANMPDYGRSAPYKSGRQLLYVLPRKNACNLYKERGAWN